MNKNRKLFNYSIVLYCNNENNFSIELPTYCQYEHAVTLINSHFGYKDISEGAPDNRFIIVEVKHFRNCIKSIAELL